MLTRLPLAFWAFVGATLVATTQVCYVRSHGGSPLFLLHAGSESPALAVLIRDFGTLPQGYQLGHDGKYFYLIARQPAFWLADAETRHGLQDPSYRYARPLYPLIAGLGGLLSPWDTLYGLILVQVLTGAALAVVLVLFARQQQLPWWFVVLALANPAIYSSVALLTSDLLALTLALFSIRYWLNSQKAIALVLFALSLLAKEYYALVPLSLAAHSLVARKWKDSITIALVPLVPIIVLKIGLLTVLGPSKGTENFTLPGLGWYQAAIEWDTPGWLLAVLATGILLMCCGMVLRNRNKLSTWLIVPWVLLALVAAKPVWGDPADLLRVVAPLWVWVLWRIAE